MEDNVIPTVAPEGHDEAMIAKIDAKNAELAASQSNEEPKQPEKILGKFASQDDLIKAYEELEKKLGAQKSEPKAEADHEVNPDEVKPDDAEKIAESAGLDIATLSDFYTANGTLGDDHYAALEKAGIPKAYVDQYIAGLEATAEKQQKAVFDEVGGQEKFQEIAAWASHNLQPAELEQYNKAIETGEISQIKAAVMSLAFKHQKSVGSEPKLIKGQPAKPAGQGFGSVAEMTAAMKDPRYATDAAYRRDVERRIANSNSI